jgi:hypothetical protein
LAQGDLVPLPGRGSKSVALGDTFFAGKQRIILGHILVSGPGTDTSERENFLARQRQRQQRSGAAAGGRVEGAGGAGGVGVRIQGKRKSR